MGDGAAYDGQTDSYVRFETPYDAERSCGTAIFEEHVDLAIVVQARAPREAPRAGRPGAESTSPLAREAVLTRTARGEPRILSDRRQPGAVEEDEIDRGARLKVRDHETIELGAPEDKKVSASNPWTIQRAIPTGPPAGSARAFDMVLPGAWLRSVTRSESTSSEVARVAAFATARHATNRCPWNLPASLPRWS